MRIPALWTQSALAALVALGVAVQVYLIAAYIFGAGGDALDAHKTAGFIVHLVEILTFLVGIGAWWRRWGMVAVAFALPALGTIQVAFSEGDEWVGAFHGLLALAVLALAGVVHVTAMREARALTAARPAA